MRTAMNTLQGIAGIAIKTGTWVPEKNGSGWELVNPLQTKWGNGVGNIPVTRAKLNINGEMKIWWNATNETPKSFSFDTGMPLPQIKKLLN